MIHRNAYLILPWIAVALTAGSWLFGLDYYYPANMWIWFALIVGAVALFAVDSTIVERTTADSTTADNSRELTAPGEKTPFLQYSPGAVGSRLGGSEHLAYAIALLLLLPVAWYSEWPYRMGPLLIVSALALRLSPLSNRLAGGAMATGVIMLFQGLAVQLYACQTARSHELFWPLPDVLAGLASLLGMDAAANGSTVVIHSMRQVHRLGATWDLFLDPATFLFYVGGALVLVWQIHQHTVFDNPPFAILWRSWLRAFRNLTLILLAWLPIRAALMMAIYVHRVLRSDPDRSLHAMNHFFSPWMLLGLLIPLVLLAWRFLSPQLFLEEDKLDSAQELAASGQRPASNDQQSSINNQQSPISNPQSPIPNPSPAIALIALAVVLLTFAVQWDPVGPRREGRVMVVERHSTWEPTNTSYDTKTFGELSGYNYTAIYNYLGQYFQMSRLLENDKIDAQTLDQCDVLVIKNPSTRYSAAEVKAVIEFVQRGGGLLLMGDHTNFEGSGTILNDITRPMGFIFRDDLLFGFGEDPYQEHFVPPSVAHPIVQHIPSLNFAVSCSIDPGNSRGRPAVAATGLWSMGPEYHHENFHPYPQHCPEMRYGAFCQVWAARHGQGRVVGFTDSTIFSNFCVFQPGKAELMLGMVEWLNHGPNPLNPRPWFLLLGAAVFLYGLWLLGKRYRRVGWLLAIAAGAFGWVVASLIVSAMHAWAMPPPECVRPMTRVVLDRTISEVPLSLGPDTQGDGNGYGLLEQWIPRLGCYTIRQEGLKAFSGNALVVICPSRSVTDEFRERLRKYVADGGKLLVIDSPENAKSTAHSLLEPFGLSIHHDRAWKGKLLTDSSLPSVDVEFACEVSGGESIAKLDQLTVAATAKYCKGSVMAIGFGSLWNDTRMGEHWMIDPDATMKSRFEVLFGFLRSFLDGKPLPAPPPEKKAPADLPMQESGPADM